MLLKCREDQFEGMIKGWFEKVMTAQDIIDEMTKQEYPFTYIRECKLVKQLQITAYESLYEVLGTDDILVVPNAFCKDCIKIVQRTDDLSKYVSNTKIAEYMRTRRPNIVIQIADDIIFGTNNFSPPTT